MWSNSLACLLLCPKPIATLHAHTHAPLQQGYRLFHAQHSPRGGNHRLGSPCRVLRRGGCQPGSRNGCLHEGLLNTRCLPPLSSTPFLKSSELGECGSQLPQQSQESVLLQEPMLSVWGLGYNSLSPPHAHVNMLHAVNLAGVCLGLFKEVIPVCVVAEAP